MRTSLQPEPPRAARGLRPAWDQRGRARCGGPSSVPHGRAGQAWSSCSRISAWEEMWSWGLGGRGVPAWMWGWLRPERRVARPAPGPRAAPCLGAWRGGRMVVSGVRGRGLRAAGEPATCGRLEPLPSCGPPGGPGVVGFPRLAFPVCAPSGFWAPLPRQVSPGTGLPGPAPPAQLILRELLVKLMVPQLPSVSRRPAPPEILGAGPPRRLAVLSVSSPTRSCPGGASVWVGLQARPPERLQRGWTGVPAALSGLCPPSEGRWQEVGWPESGLRLEEAQAFSLGAAAASHLLPVLQLQRLGVGGRGGGRPESKPLPPTVSPGAPSPRRPPPLEEDPPVVALPALDS